MMYFIERWSDTLLGQFFVSAGPSPSVGTGVSNRLSAAIVDRVLQVCARMRICISRIVRSPCDFYVSVCGGGGAGIPHGVSGQTGAA